MVEKAAGKAVVPAGGLTERDLEIAAEIRRTAPGARLQELTVGSAAAALAAGMADAAGKPPPEALVGYSPEHATSRKPAWLLGFQRPRILTPPSL
jgi:hypothetical protein